MIYETWKINPEIKLDIERGLELLMEGVLTNAESILESGQGAYDFDQLNRRIGKLNGYIDDARNIYGVGESYLREFVERRDMLLERRNELMSRGSN